MNQPAPTVPFTHRSATNCLDLAVMYCGRRLPALITLWLCAALPSCALVYVLTYFFEFDLRLPLLVIYITTAIYGGWLTVALTPGIYRRILRRDPRPPDAGPFPAEYLTFAAVALGGVFIALLLSRAQPFLQFRGPLCLLTVALFGIVLFGRAVLELWKLSDDRLSVTWPVLAAAGVRFGVGAAPIVLLCFVNGWAISLAILSTIFIALPLLARVGFAAERSCLTQYHDRLHHSGTDGLIKGEMGDLFLRLCTICIFYFILWTVLFFTVDILSSLLFQTDILIGKLGEFGGFSHFWTYIATDPILLTTWTATGLMAYPITRVAWFLCYIDVRVRRDCWDLELSLAREAARLKDQA